MAGRAAQTFKKRQKEQQRKEKQQEKMANRLARKGSPATTDQDDASSDTPHMPENETDASAG